MGSVNNTEPRQERTPEIRPLDMFLLGLVRGGLITPYDWQSKARTSLGASLPSVRRLIAAGLLKREANGPRGRHEFALTAKGEDELDNLDRYIQDVLDEPHTDLETVIRLVCLATVARDKRTSKELLFRASVTHRERARLARRRAASKDPIRSGLGALYSTVLSYCEAEQETAIADQLTLIRRRWDSVSKEVIQLWDDWHKPGR